MIFLWGINKSKHKVIFLRLTTKLRKYTSRELCPHLFTILEYVYD